MKRQVIVIHGADSFGTYDEYMTSLKNREVSIESFLPRKSWKDNLLDNLGSEFEVLLPRMPNKDNAQYEEWKIWFEKMFPFIHDEVVLVGHSQGGIFLAKYLSENKFLKKIKKLILVAAPYSSSEGIGSFALNKPLDSILGQCGDIHLYQSKDDFVVPYSEVEYYKNDLSKAKIHLYNDRGHFLQEYFPEIVEEIKID